MSTVRFYVLWALVTIGISTRFHNPTVHGLKSLGLFSRELLKGHAFNIEYIENETSPATGHSSYFTTQMALQAGTVGGHARNSLLAVVPSKFNGSRHRLNIQQKRTKIYVLEVPEKFSNRTLELLRERLMPSNFQWIYFVVIFGKVDESKKSVLGQIQSMPTDFFGSKLHMSTLAFFVFVSSWEEIGSARPELTLFVLKDKVFCRELIFEGPIGIEDLLGEQRRRQDFEKVTLTAVAVFIPHDWDSAVVFGNSSNGELEYVGGYEGEAILYLAEALNFRLKAIKYADFIRFDADGKPVGLSEPIISGMADVATSAIDITEPRRKHVTFLHPMYDYLVTAYMLMPPRSASGSVFVRPFQWKTWEAFASSLVLLGVCTLVVHFVRQYFQTPISESDLQVSDEAFIWAVGSACQQGWHVVPKSLPLRFIFLFGYMTGMICSIGYSTTLVSMITTEGLPVKSLPEWSQLGYKFFADVHFADEVELVHNNQFKFDRELSLEAALDLMMRGKLIVVAAATSFYSFIHHYLPTHQVREDCENKLETECLASCDKFVCNNVHDFLFGFPRTKSGMVVKPKSPIKEPLNVKTLMMIQSGVHPRNLKRFFVEKTLQCNAKSDGMRAMEMKDVYPAFILVGSGVWISLIALGSELMMFRYLRIRALNKFLM